MLRVVYENYFSSCKNVDTAMSVQHYSFTLTEVFRNFPQLSGKVFGVV
jgi:hypothetical protein